MHLVRQIPAHLTFIQTQSVTCLTVWEPDPGFDFTDVINSVILSLMTRNTQSLEFVSDPKATLPGKVLKFLIHCCLKQGRAAY